MNVKLSGTKQSLKVSYYIADENIAVISADGKIAGLLPGKTTLTAILNGKTYTTQIIVE